MDKHWSMANSCVSTMKKEKSTRKMMMIIIVAGDENSSSDYVPHRLIDFE